MGKYNKPKGEGWSKEEEAWLNSLPIQDAADLFWMSENGPDNKKDEDTLERLRKSYQKAMTHRAKEWATQHKTAIIICGGIAVCIGVGVWGNKRINIVEPVLKTAVPQSSPVMTPTLKTNVVDSFRDESEVAREILRRAHIRILGAGRHASPEKIVEAAKKGIELRTGETFVNSCTVRIKCA